jgi:heme exporter protein B
MGKEIWSLVRKEMLLEWRQKYALNGILLYLVSTVFVCYLSFRLRQNQLNPITWNALFWIILLFTSVNAAAKSFLQESDGRQFYYYTLAGAHSIILSKMIYNSLLMSLLGLLGFLFYSLVLGNPVQDQWLFILNLLLGCIGLGSALSMVAAIAAKAQNNSTLMAVLSFPVVLPLLLMLIKTSKNAMDGLATTASYDELSIIASMNVIVVATAYLLFPSLWRS